MKRDQSPEKPVLASLVAAIKPKSGVHAITFGQ
jgi:hypothetical protein